MRKSILLAALLSTSTASANTVEHKIECKLYTGSSGVVLSMMSDGPDGYRFDGSSDDVHVEGKVQDWNRVSVKIIGRRGMETAVSSQVTPINSMMVQAIVETRSNHEGTHATVICRVP